MELALKYPYQDPLGAIQWHNIESTRGRDQKKSPWGGDSQGLGERRLETIWQTLYIQASNP